MLNNAVVTVVRLCTRYAYATLAVGLIFAGISTYYATKKFEITTDIGKLISTNQEWRQREIAFDKAFPGRNDLILAVVEAPTPEQAQLAAAALEKNLTGRPEFRSVQRAGGGDFFEKHGLLFLSRPELEKMMDQLGSAEPLLQVLVDDPSLRGLTGALEFALSGVNRGQLQLDSMAKTLDAFSEPTEQVLAGKPTNFSWRELISEKPLTASDRRQFLEIHPVLDYQNLEPGREGTDAIRKVAAELDLAGKYNARVRLTGPVPIANEEFATVKDGMVRDGILTVTVVLFILWMALKSPKIIFAVFITLGIGLSMTTAVGLWLVTALNPISIAFMVLFVGLGVDFGIQYSVRYRNERYEVDDLQTALEKGGEYSAVPLTLAAAATAAGFLSFLPTAYKGVSELGEIAGAGMIIAFVMAITVLPALLKIFNPSGEKEPVGYAFLAPVDNFLEVHRVPVIVGTLAVAIIGAPLLYWVQFDFNPINLRSPKVESIATYLDLRTDPNTGASAVEVLAPNLNDAKARSERIAKLPEVSRTMTLDSFVPQDQPAKLAMIRKASETVGQSLNPPSKGDAPTDEENVTALKDTVESLRKIAGNKSGEGAIAAKRLADVMEKVAAADEATRVRIQNLFVQPMMVMIEGLRTSLQAQQITIKSLPQALARNWMTEDGRARIEVLPKGDPNDNDTLRAFASAVQKVEPAATGGPVSILESGHTIVTAFLQAGGWALGSIFIILWLSLRRVTDVLLTLVPLLLAGVVTLEICVLIGLKLNFANIIALPLLLGVGVAFKIYYVTAWRGGQTNLLQSSLTRAIFFSALTTATAFGSLWLSSHPGTSSMGKLMALSLVTTLAAAVLFQPALMGKPRNGNGDGEEAEKAADEKAEAAKV